MFSYILPAYRLSYRVALDADIGIRDDLGEFNDVLEIRSGQREVVSLAHHGGRLFSRNTSLYNRRRSLGRLRKPDNSSRWRDDDMVGIKRQRGVGRNGAWRAHHSYDPASFNLK